MNKKRILAVALTVATLSTPMVANAQSQGWSKTGNNWIYINGQNRREKGWLKVGNVWYHFNQNGIMETGWVYTGGAWYFLDNSGAMRTGWIYTDGAWYFLEESGSMKTGWLYDKNYHNWFYLNESGSMKTGWLYDKNYSAWYFLNSNGEMAKSQFAGEYYLGKDGKMLKNTTVQGYRLDASGLRHKITSSTSNTNTKVDNHKDTTTVPNKPKDDVVVPEKPKEKDVPKPEKPKDKEQPKDEGTNTGNNDTTTQTNADMATFKKQVQDEFLKLLNEHRKRNGLNTVEYHRLAQIFAKNRAEYMAKTDYVEHSDKSGRSSGDIYDSLPEVIEYNKSRYNPDHLTTRFTQKLMENILAAPKTEFTKRFKKNNPKELAKYMIDLWIASPGHNAALLRKTNSSDLDLYVGFDFEIGSTSASNLYVYAQYNIISIEK